MENVFGAQRSAVGPGEDQTVIFEGAVGEAGEPIVRAVRFEFSFTNKTAKPMNPFDTAVLIGDRKRELGARTMRLLANTADMGELRVESAMSSTVRRPCPLRLCQGGAAVPAARPI